MKKRWCYLFLGLILILGFGLRLYNLGKEDFDIDEIYTIKMMKRNFMEIFPTTGKDVHPPLFYVLLWFFTRIFGFSEFFLRFPSLIFGVLSIFMIFKLASLLFDKKVGLMAAFILAINPFHIYYAQEARMYTQLVFFTLCSVFFLVKGLRNNKIKDWIFYILFTSAVIYTHYWGFLLLLTEGLYSLIFLRKKLYVWFRAYAIILISYIIWLPWLFTAFLFEKKRYDPNVLWFVENNILFTWTRVFIYLKVFLFGFATGYLKDIPIYFTNLFSGSLNYNYSSVSFLDKYGISILLVIFLSFSIFALFNLKKDIKEVILLLSWFLIPLILIFVLTFFLKSFFIIRQFERLFIFITPAFYILISKGLIDIGKKRWIIFLFLIFFLSINLHFLNISHHTDFKERWQGMLAFVNETYDKSDVLLLSSQERWRLAPFKYYYDKKNYNFSYTRLSDLTYGNIKNRINCSKSNLTSPSLLACLTGKIFVAPVPLDNNLSRTLFLSDVYSFGCHSRVYTYSFKKLDPKVKIIEDFETRYKRWYISDSGEFNLDSNIQTQGEYSIKINFKKKDTGSSFVIDLLSPSCLDVLFWEPYKFLEFDIFPLNVELDKIRIHAWNTATKTRLINGKYIKDFSKEACNLGQWCHIKINFKNQTHSLGPIQVGSIHIYTDKINSKNKDNIFYLDNMFLSND